jgi:DNA-binding XRE family transcriptional regulator
MRSGNRGSYDGGYVVELRDSNCTRSHGRIKLHDSLLPGKQGCPYCRESDPRRVYARSTGRDHPGIIMAWFKGFDWPDYSRLSTTCINIKTTMCFPFHGWREYTHIEIAYTMEYIARLAFLSIAPTTPEPRREAEPDVYFSRIPVRQHHTQMELARRCDINRAHVSNLERGMRKQCLSTIVRLSKSLATPAADIMGRYDGRM